MTRQKSDTLFELEPLPGDKVTSEGRRHRGSPWATYQRQNLQVTQADIDGALRENSHSCMIADAIKRQIKGAERVAVDIATIRWTDTIKNRRIVCLTPLACQDGLVKFDLGIAPGPFSFHLRSTQITTASHRPVVGEDGKTVKRKRTVVGADGVQAVTEVAKLQRVAVPKPRVEPFRGDQPVVLGGAVPPHHRASRNRKFGVKGFTWLDGERPEDIVARQRVSYGVDKS